MLPVSEKVSTVQKDVLRDRIHITFITVYCNNCSILLLVVVNLLLCLIHKLNFIIGTYVQKREVYIVFGTSGGSRNPLGVWGHIPALRIREGDRVRKQFFGERHD